MLLAFVHTDIYIFTYKVVPWPLIVTATTCFQTLQANHPIATACNKQQPQPSAPTACGFPDTQLTDCIEEAAGLQLLSTLSHLDSASMEYTDVRTALQAAPAWRELLKPLHLTVDCSSDARGEGRDDDDSHVPLLSQDSLQFCRDLGLVTALARLHLTSGAWPILRAEAGDGARSLCKELTGKQRLSTRHVAHGLPAISRTD